jgi:beta-glucosidase
MRCFLIFIALNVGLHAAETASPAQLQQYPYGLAQGKIEARVEKILSQLTLDEKISMLAGDGIDGMSTVAIPRLGIPKLIMADGPQGIRAHGPACSFPSGIALAATWDTKLAFRYGEALGREARARGIHIQLGPGVNIARTPLNGRNFEYFGEDPFLTGEMAAQWISGLQSQGVAATVKHFVGNDEEWRRMEINAVMDEQTLREIYLIPFQSAVKEGGVWAVMSAYNKLNDSPSTANNRLQNGILKGEWGFPGLVMSDWWATQSVDALARGLDLEMPMSYQVTPESVSKALADKSLTQDRIDDAVRRQLRMMISMGFLDRPQERPDLPLDSPKNSALALQVATRSIVLLKNSPALLPLDKDHLNRIVVYGPNAQDTPAVGGGSGGVIPFHKVSFLEGIRNALPEGASVTYTPMPINKSFSISDFLDFTAVLPPPPRITSIRRLVSVTEENMTRINSSHPQKIAVSWSKHFPPPDIPKGREGRVSWDAEIELPESGSYEILSEGHPEIRLADRELGNPASYIVTVKKAQNLPLRVTASEVGRGSGHVSVRILPVPESATGIIPAQGADAAIVCVGLNPEIEGEGYDRGFSLPVEQQRLIEEVSAANPRTIVVLSGGAAVNMFPWIEKVPAVLQTWYLGQSAGTALASILFGNENPSGHLPCTFDRSIQENPAYPDYPGDFQGGQEWPVVNYREGIFYGYRGYDKAGGQPMFPFGYGLSYTTFSLEDLVAIPAKEGYQMSLSVSNTGKRYGATVVQLYVSLGGESTPRPLRELKGFQRVALQPGETRKITIFIRSDSLRYWNPVKNYWVDPEGPIKIEAGLSERDIKQSITLPLHR